MNKITIVTYFSWKSKETLVGYIRPFQLARFFENNQINYDVITTESKLGFEITVKKPNILNKNYFFLKLLIPDRTILWAVKTFRYIRKTKSKGDVILTTLPPNGVGLLGLLVKMFSSNKWILDYRDIYVDNPLHSNSLIKKKLNSIFEYLFNKNADLIITNTEHDLRFISQKYSFVKSKVICIRNGYDYLNHDEKERENYKLVYMGGTTKGQATKYIERLIDTLNSSGEQFSCDLYGEYDDFIATSKHIKYRGILDNDKVGPTLSKYQFGLVYLPENCINGGRVNQKFYDYIGAGVCPICINPSLEMVEMMNDLGIGISLFSNNNEWNILQQIKNISNFPTHTANHYSRINQFKYLVKELKNRKFIN